MHYKGSEVEIICLALDSEDLKELVVYKHIEAARGMPAGQVWVRPKKMFLGNVVKNGKEVERFTLVKD